MSEYILHGWEKTVRETKAVAEGDTLIPLPKPYTVPCMDTHFQELYYWDTYFTNRGLILSGRVDLAINNIENFAHLIEIYGFIPNGSRTWYLNRSQPPFFGLMIADVYEATKDEAFLSWAVESLKKEYSFWETKRKSSNGLNCYSADATEQECRDIIKLYHERTGILREGDVAYWGKNILAEAESGWDFNERFAGRCHEYNPVDLNSLLYFNERFIGYAEEILGRDGGYWNSRANERKRLVNAYLVGEDGIYYDYSYKDKTRSKLLSSASFVPYFTGLCTEKGGAQKLLASLEMPYGIGATEQTASNYQWGYKNGWACLQLIAVEGLARCGLQTEANRVAEKYVKLVEKVYKETGKLWEKYNVMDGNANAVGEYGTPEMLGWTAGVYVALKEKGERQ